MAVKDSISFTLIASYIIYIFAVISLFLIYMTGELVMINLAEKMGVVFSEALGAFDTPGVGAEK